MPRDTDAIRIKEQIFDFSSSAPPVVLFLDPCSFHSICTEKGSYS